MSLTVLYGHTEFVRGWVRERIPSMQAAEFGPSTALGVMDGQRLIAGLVYHDWQPWFKSIQLSCAAVHPKWASRRILAEVFAYPFHQLGVNRIVAVTETDNHKTRRILEGIGYTLEGIGVKAFGEKDAASYRLLKDEWEAGRFHLKGKRDGQKVESAKAA